MFVVTRATVSRFRGDRYGRLSYLAEARDLGNHRTDRALYDLGHAPFLFAGLIQHRPGGWNHATLLDSVPPNQIRFCGCAIPFEIKLRYDCDSTTVMRGHR